MKIDKKNKRQIIELIIFCGIILWAVLHYKVFINLFKFITKLIMPLIIGIAIAFIINVPMKQIERKIFKIDKRKHKKIIRVISLILSIVLIFGIVGLIFFLIIPEFIQAASAIGKSLPSSFDWLNDLIDKMLRLYPGAHDFIKNIDLNKIVTTTIGSTKDIVNILMKFLSGIISKLVKFFMGFIISIYVLIDKENLSGQSKKFLMAFLPEKSVKKIINVVKLTNSTFTNFLTGQFLDACLTGFEFFIILSIIKIPYSLILGVLFAITALIPYVGAFITLVIGVTLVAVTNPINALWYIIAFFIVQQFDDNFTYPKIVGKSVGLPALWSLIAVLIGGAIFGFVGMIISIPIASILYTLLKELVNNRLKEKSENNY